MTDARKVLLLTLVPLVALPVVLGVLGALGSVEWLLWLALAAAWVVVFVLSGRRRDDVGTT